MMGMMKVMMDGRRLSQSLVIGPALVLGLLVGPISWGQESTGTATTEKVDTQPTEPVELGDLPKAEDLFAGHLKAIGGEKAIRKHKSHTTKAIFAMPAAGMETEILIYVAAPNSFLMKLSIPAMGEVIQGYNGKTAWSMDPMSGVSLIEGEQLNQFKVQADFFADINYKKIYQKMTTVGLVEFAKTSCYQVHTTTSFKQDGEIFFNVETGLIQGMESTSETQMGPMKSTTILKDYQEFGGVKRPVSSEITTFGQKQLITVKSVEYDKVDPKIFALPPAIKTLLESKEDDADDDDNADDNQDDQDNGHGHDHDDDGG